MSGYDAYKASGQTVLCEGISMPPSMLGHCCSTYQQTLLEEAYVDPAIPPKISSVVIHRLVYAIVHF
jgi:hypothetical protein